MEEIVSATFRLCKNVESLCMIPCRAKMMVIVMAVSTCLGRKSAEIFANLSLLLTFWWHAKNCGPKVVHDMR